MLMILPTFDSNIYAVDSTKATPGPGSAATERQVIAKMGAKAPLLVFPTWTSQPLASEDAAQRRAGGEPRRGGSPSHIS